MVKLVRANLPTLKKTGSYYVAHVTVAAGVAYAVTATLAGKPTPVAFPLMPVAVKTPALPLLIAAPAPGEAGQWLHPEAG